MGNDSLENRATAFGEVLRFFDKVDAIINARVDFSVMEYPFPKRVLFKVLLDDNAQFTAEIVQANWSEMLRKEEISDLLFHALFTRDKAVGSITLTEIMHDAAPVDASLASFFVPNANSLYKDAPMGTHGGDLAFLRRDKNSVIVSIRDFSRDNISGTYELSFTDERRKDGKGRDAVVVKFRKAN